MDASSAQMSYSELSAQSLAAFTFPPGSNSPVESLGRVVIQGPRQNCGTGRRWPLECGEVKFGATAYVVDSRCLPASRSRSLFRDPRAADGFYLARCSGRRDQGVDARSHEASV